MPMPETSHPIPFYAISTPRQVAAACSIAVVQPNLRPYVEKAALRLGVPTLPESPAALFDPGRRRELDTVVRAVALSTGSDYPGALGALRGAWEDVRAEIGMGAVTLARVAERAGVRALDSLAQDINTLQSRDAEAVKMLDAATSALPARRVDGQGRVLVEQGFDLPHYRPNDEPPEPTRRSPPAPAPRS